MAVIVKKVPVNEIKPDMVLAEDVFTLTGSVLFSRDTMLNNINFTKLKANDIDFVFVKANSIDENRPPMKREIHTLERQQIPITERKEFIAFENAYEEKREEMKKTLHAISDGDAIDLEELYELTDGIMNKLKCKSDIFSFIGFIKSADEHTYTHCNNVALLCNLFSNWVGFDQEKKMHLTVAGVLHDIGKTKTPPHILNKNGRLTDDELIEMKKHPVQGYRILEKQDIPESVKLAALMHHEKIDGTGYPLRAKEDQINEYAKIVAICDIYDAMTANRIYRGKICPFDVIKSFETNCYGELDTKNLLIFLRNIAYTYIGSWVTLTDGRKAEVMFINQSNLSRPIVKTLDNAVIDLATEKNLTIVSLA